VLEEFDSSIAIASDYYGRILPLKAESYTQRVDYTGVVIYQ
jgi:hypothetical protein